MATVALAPQNDATTQAISGVNTSVTMSFAPVTGEYVFPEVKTGLVADLFPSDDTWHPLYNHDYKEIAGHLFSIEGMKVPVEQKHALVDKVRQVTIESYHHGAMYIGH
jgi:hypothetical protein